MPPHPTPQKGGEWYFDFPTEPNSVHYVLAAVNMAAASDVEANISVPTIETLGSAGATTGFFSFGGGSFFGHGVRVRGGEARFALTTYAVK
jgi:hypothetical protein